MLGSKSSKVAFIGCENGFHAYTLGSTLSDAFSDSHFVKKWTFAPSANSESLDNYYDSKPALSRDEGTVYATSSVEGFVRAFNVRAARMTACCGNLGQRTSQPF